MIDINTVEVRLGNQLVGKMVLTPDRLCAFQYDAEYLTDGIAVSPFALPLTPELFVAKRLPFDGNFGVFDDSLPDGWGRLVLDRYLRKSGEDPMKLNALQLLSIIGSNGRGALEYKPETTVIEPSKDIIVEVTTICEKSRLKFI
jgi:serine/threonine-protein kinase HipA